MTDEALLYGRWLCGGVAPSSKPPGKTVESKKRLSYPAEARSQSPSLKLLSEEESDVVIEISECSQQLNGTDIDIF